MDNIFKQVTNFTRIYFDTYHSDLELLDDFMPENIVAITMNEVKSETVESAKDDLWRVEIFIDEQSNIDDILATINGLKNEKSLQIIGKIQHENFVNNDWQSGYEAQLKPIIIDNFYISSDEKADQIKNNQIPICIKSSRAFGTGDHETTSGCIRLMSRLESRTINKILDIGTGSGVLSFVAKKIWSKSFVSACDIDAQSLEVARLNSTYNNSDIDFFQNDEHNLLSSTNFLKEYDLIIANILQNPLIEMAESITSISNKNTSLILSGFLSKQSKNIENEYSKHGWIMADKVSTNGWDAILLKVNVS